MERNIPPDGTAIRSGRGTPERVTLAVVSLLVSFASVHPRAVRFRPRREPAETRRDERGRTDPYRPLNCSNTPGQRSPTARLACVRSMEAQAACPTALQRPRTSTYVHR